MEERPGPETHSEDERQAELVSQGATREEANEGGGSSTEQAGPEPGRDPADAAGEEPSTLDGFKDWVIEIFGQASDLVMRPGEFFTRLPSEEGSWKATAFAIAMGFVAGILGFVLGVLPGFKSVFTSPFAAFAATVVGAFLIHALAMVANGKASLEASYRLAAYLMVFFPLVVVAGVLPYLHIAMAGYALYALIMGAIAVHGLEERRAWSVFGAAGAALLVIALIGKVTSSGSMSALQTIGQQQRQAAERLERRIDRLRERSPAE